MADANREWRNNMRNMISRKRQIFSGECGPHGGKKWLGRNPLVRALTAAPEVNAE
jgi:hypothetical protein